MKKWFKNTKEAQMMPANIRSSSKGAGVKVEDKNAMFIVLWHGQNSEGWSYQILVNMTHHFKNNEYQACIFDDDDNYVDVSFVPSKCLYPPIWDRKAGVEYRDYYEVMSALNRFMWYNNKEMFEFDLSKDDKYFYLVKKSQEEIEESLEQGGSYEIAVVKSEAFFNSKK